MEHQPITPETELMAIELGYPFAPIQSILQKWLREGFRINVFVGFRININKWDSHAYDMNLSVDEYVKLRNMKKFLSQETFERYEDALEVGLMEGLMILKERLRGEKL